MERNMHFKIPAGSVAMGLAAIVLVAVLGTLSTRPLSQTQEKLTVLQKTWAPSTIALHELRAELAELRTYELAQISHAGDPDQVADYDRRIAEKLKGIGEQLAVYEATEPPAEQAALAAQVKRKLADYLAVHTLIADAIHQGDVAGARELSTSRALPLRRDLFNDIVVLTDKAYDRHPTQALAER